LLLPLAAVQVNKDDLLSMVRYGAELVFSSEATNITGKLLATV
jgi:SWI/SNF-related matrix-associated actin-dependent regulator of chromatin subfamily A member 5